MGVRSASATIGEGNKGYCLLPLLLATILWPGVLRGQRPRFDATQLTCVQFDVRVRTTVTTTLQGQRRMEEIRRDGRLVVQGTPSDSGIRIEAWWDSLSLSRRADSATLAPDPSGLLGGRYRGLLTPDGRFVRAAAPWIPDEVAEVSDLSLALDDLFPDLAGSRVRSLSDSAHIHRYRLTSSKETDAPPEGDRSFAVHESESSDGVLAWAREGLLSWVRLVTAETRVSETAQRAFRSVLAQRIEVRRVGNCNGVRGESSSAEPHLHRYERQEHREHPA